MEQRTGTTLLEKEYWLFSALTALSNDMHSKTTQQWKLFSLSVVPTVKSKLRMSFKNNQVFQKLPSFFDPHYSSLDIAPIETTLLGSDINILLIINSEDLPVDYDANNNLGLAQKLRVISEVSIHEMSKSIIEAVEYVQKNPQVSQTWKLEPKSNRMDGILKFTFTTDKFRYNVLPVLKSIDDSFLLICNGKLTAYLEPWRDMYPAMKIINETFQGFFQIIKFWEALLQLWNKDNPNAVVSLSVIESIAYAYTNHSSTSAKQWNDEFDFQKIFSIIANDLKNGLLSGSIQSINNGSWNLIGDLPKEGAQNLIAWIDKLPAYDADPSLLTFVSKWNAGQSPPQMIPSNVPQQIKPVSDMDIEVPQTKTEARKRFNDVVVRERQWKELCQLLDANWRELGDELGKTKLEMDVIERRAKWPVRELLDEWSVTPNAYIDTFVQALKAIDHFDAKLLIERWLNPDPNSNN